MPPLNAPTSSLRPSMKTVLFDIGNVLLAFDFHPALSTLEGPNARPDAVDLIMAQKDIFEAGKQEKAEYIQWASELLDFQGGHAAFERAWTSIFTPVQAMWDLARQLKAKGYRLILFSNTNSIHAPYCLSSYPDFSLFDGAVFSHEIGSIKPDPAFYKSAIKLYDLIPEQTFYIDDLEANIREGQNFGFTSFIYDLHNHEAFLSSFNRALNA